MTCTDVNGNPVFCGDPSAMFSSNNPDPVVAQLMSGSQPAGGTSPYHAFFATPAVWIVWLACAALCGFLATHKNRNVGRAVAAGVVFGVFALAYYCGAKSQPEVSA